MKNQPLTEEEKRLDADRLGHASWKLWGPYLSERQWGTVREDYSENGTAWEYFPHDHARSRTYRWGEDGIAGISDDHQCLCFALALWNGRDPILKERLFGLTGNEGNHGEDVKEYYFYLDNVPTHAYMKYLYKYPQQEFPYKELVEVNKKRTRHDFEYELLDTGIFNDDRYFDVFVEYAKESEEDILIRISVANRGPEAAKLDLLPTLWYKNIWAWDQSTPKPNLSVVSANPDFQVIHGTQHPKIADYWLYCCNPDQLLFTNNETNSARIFNFPNASAYVKDGINDYIVNGKRDCVDPSKQGTKAAVHYKLTIEPGETAIVKLRLSNNGSVSNPFDAGFDNTFKQRIKEADEFYFQITPYNLPEDMRNIQRQAFAGLLWNKQYYHYPVQRWLDGDPTQPPPPEGHLKGRNCQWWSLNAANIFSMPDKWEYPWFAAWDLAFHTVSLAMIDPEFAKQQLMLLTREWYMYPNGQIPAYEWAFSDVNPPVHAWAAYRVYNIERKRYGREDRDFLEGIFQKLVLNFTWWVNRKDADGRNIFEGGFLGLDNIGAFDRTLGPPSGGILEQPDGTGWMGMYSLNLLQISLELAFKDHVYEDMATKFFEHFVYIADAINNIGGHSCGLWDEERGFYYGVVITPEEQKIRMLEDNFADLIPLFAVATNEGDQIGEFPDYLARFKWFMENRPGLLKDIADLNKLGIERRILLSFANPEKLKRILVKVLDENQFFSSYGIRSVSKRHAREPFSITLGGKLFTLDYEPAESTTGLFGGNSNWRGPIWFPLNYLMIESLQKFHYYLGDDYKIECPTGSGHYKTLWEVSTEINHRLLKIFLKDENGRRPVYGGIEKFQTDPHWRDYILFHEYFHGDNGAGLGASNQTGWTGLVAKMINQYAEYALQNKPPLLIEKAKVGNV